jgi:drug/metabolite transporter (DMT)-like permease
VTGVIVAVYSSFFLGLAEATLKKAYKEFPASVAFALNSILAVLIWCPLALYLGVDFHFLMAAVPYALISAVISEALYFYALTKGQLSITSILIGTYAIYTVLFSVILNGERLTPQQLTGVSITIVGTLMVYLPSKFSRAELRKMRAIAIPAGAAVIIGLSDTLSKGFINQTNDYTFLFALALVQLPVAIVYLRIERQSFTGLMKEVAHSPAHYKQALGGSFFSVIGTGLLWVSFTLTLASIASPVTATSGAIVVLLAVFLLDENLNIRTLIGLITTFAGVIVISAVNGGV